MAWLIVTSIMAGPYLAIAAFAIGASLLRKVRR